jgi:hypothetical protein
VAASAARSAGAHAPSPPLQALASCISVADELKVALDIVGGGAEGADGAAPLAASLAALVASGASGAAPATLAESLSSLLRALQPSPRPRAALSSQPLLIRLRAAFGADPFAPDEQQDAAEALELLMEAAAGELRAAFRAPGGAAARLHRAGALAAALGRPAAADPALAAWRGLRPALEGLSAAEMACTRCGHAFATELSPFSVLHLAVPTGPARAAAGALGAALGLVPAAPGAALERCLQQAVDRFELVEGVACPRCSLKATLAAAGGGGGGAGDGSSNSAALSDLRPLLAGPRGGALPDEARLRARAAAAGAAWVPRAAPAARRAGVARWPRCLALHLRRAVWAPGGRLKVTGPVSFPDRLPGQPGRPAYRLRAVVAHAGVGARGGHWVCFRAVRAKVPAAAADGGAGGAGGAPRAAEVHAWWVRASDAAVEPAALADVFAAEASLLLYERVRGAGGGAPKAAAPAGAP